MGSMGMVLMVPASCQHHMTAAGGSTLKAGWQRHHGVAIGKKLLIVSKEACYVRDLPFELGGRHPAMKVSKSIPWPTNPPIHLPDPTISSRTVDRNI
jgi:hypothetical protein